MLQVQATEAKANFAELLRTVESGETVVITRHGKKIARLVPDSDQDRADRLEAMKRLKKTRSELGGIKMSTEEIREARHGDSDSNSDADQERAERKAAVERFKAIRKTWEPTGMTREEILALRHEGHRY